MSNLPTAPVTPAPVSQTTPSSNDKINPALAQYPLKQSNVNRLASSPPVYQESSVNYEKVRLKERKSKYTVNSYLTLSLDTAEESISFIDPNAANQRTAKKKKQVLKSRSPVPFSDAPTMLGKQKVLTRGMSTESSNSKGRNNSSSSKGDCNYFYKSENLPSTHEQHLIHSPYYRALFGNTAALPNGEIAESNIQPEVKSFRTLSQDSTDSIISKGNLNSPSSSHKHAPRLRTESHDSSTSTSSSSSSSSSSDDEQEYQLKRSHSTGSSHSHSNTQLKRLNSLSNSNNNLRRALYNASVIRSAGNGAEDEEDDAEGSKEEKNELACEVSSEISLPKLTIDADVEDHPSLQNYNEEYPVLRSPKTASQLLLESKGLSPKTSSNDLHSYSASGGTSPSSSHKTPLPPNVSPSSSHKTPLPVVTPSAGKSFPLSLTPPVSATSSSSNPHKTPSSALSNKMSIITNIQQFMMMTPSNQPSSHTKVARSPRFFEVTSATKKRITSVSTPNNNDESVRKVISLNEEGNLLKRSESDEGVSFTAPPASSTFSPFRKELPESFLFSPPNVIPAIAAQTSMITSSIGLASPFMSPSSSFQQLARDNATAERAMAASSQAMRSLKTQDSVDPTRQITFEPCDLEGPSAEDESDVMLMSKSKSRSDDYESHDEQTLEGFIYHVTDLEEHHELINREQLTEDLNKEKSSTIPDVLVRNRSPTFKMPPELEINGPDTIPPLMRQPSFQDTTKFIVDKVKVSRFIFNKIVADAIPKAPIAVQTRVKRWDDPDSDSEEEEDVPPADDVSFMTQLNELVDEYHSQLNLTLSIIQQKQEKKFFLFEHQYYHPLLLHQQSRGGAKNRKELTKKEAKEEKAKQKESLLAFEDVDFLWFHKLIANYLQEENVHYFDILSSLSEGTNNNNDNDEEENDHDHEENDEESLNHNLHKICQYLISSHFYYHLISLLPNEDQRFSSKIYELIKILYVQIHQNDMKYYESIEGGGTSELHREKIKLKYLKNLVDRNHLRPTGSVTNTPTAAGGVVSCPSYDSSEGGSVEFKGPYQCQSSDSCDTMMSYTSCEGDLTYREIPLLMLESVYLVCQERYSRCLTSSKQSYEQELDVNFIAQKGFLSISSTVHHYQHPLHHQSNDSSTSFPWANTTTTTSSSSVPSSPSSSSLNDHIHASLTTHYSLHSIMQGSKEERQPFRINDSDYYLLELMKYIIKYEYEYMISRLYNGIYDITLVIKNMMIMKYLCLGVMELMKCYGNRLGLTSELVEYPQLLQQLLDVMEALIFFYHTILFELECIENNLITDEEDDDEDDEDEDDEEGGGGKEIDHYVVILLQKVYILLSSTVNSHLNSNNLFYLVLHFIQNQWKHSNTKPEDGADDSSIERKNYAQEILYIKLFELLLHYLPPERIIFPNVSMYDQISTALPPTTVPTTQPPSSTKSATTSMTKTTTTPIITLPSLTMNVYHKLLIFIKQIFYKIILSLDYQHHFKTIQTIFTFFFNQQSLLLYQYCFPIDFSFFLEELKTPTPPAPPPTLNTPPTSVATATTSSTFTFPSTPSMNINGTTTISTTTTMQRHYQQKLKETKLFNEHNEERLQLLVEKLRVLRSEYWNPMIKNVANQLLDLIFYQMEQLEEANNHDDEEG